MSQQEDVVGCKAEGKDQENDGGQAYCSLFLGCLGVFAQFAYDTDIAECCDTEREEEEDECQGEEEGCPGKHRWKHVFFQHVKACGDPEFGDVKGQVCGHQWVQHTQNQTPHEEAADDSNNLFILDISKHHGSDNAQVAVNTDGHHGQDGTVHVGVEDEGQETVGGNTENSMKMCLLAFFLKCRQQALRLHSEDNCLGFGFKLEMRKQLDSVQR